MTMIRMVMATAAASTSIITTRGITTLEEEEEEEELFGFVLFSVAGFCTGLLVVSSSDFLVVVFTVPSVQAYCKYIPHQKQALVQGFSPIIKKK